MRFLECKDKNGNKNSHRGHMNLGNIAERGTREGDREAEVAVIKGESEK